MVDILKKHCFRTNFAELKKKLPSVGKTAIKLSNPLVYDLKPICCHNIKGVRKFVKSEFCEAQNC